jgi:hypothetical protein
MGVPRQAGARPAATEAEDEGQVSLYDRTILLEKLSAPAKQALIKQVEKAASKIAGKPLTVSKTKEAAKGVDLRFKQGGQFKIRPKPDGAVLAKLQGQPKPSYRFLGVGTDAESAIAALKPEKGGKAGFPPPPKAVKPKPKPKKKPKKPKGPPGPAYTKINGMRFHNDLQVSADVFHRYAQAAKDATDLIKQYGLGFMLSKVSMHLRTGGPGVLGNYDMTKAVVEIFVNNLGPTGKVQRIMLTMVHELGHHYYYREIPRHLRKTYKWYFGLAKKPTEKGAKTGDFPSAYGTTKRYEDFAEIFAAYVGKGYKLEPKRYKLTKDIMDRFRTFLSQDKRIKLHETERTLFRRRLVVLDQPIRLENFPNSPWWSQPQFDLEPHQLAPKKTPKPKPARVAVGDRLAPEPMDNPLPGNMDTRTGLAGAGSRWHARNKKVKSTKPLLGLKRLGGIRGEGS